MKYKIRYTWCKGLFQFTQLEIRILNGSGLKSYLQFVDGNNPQHYAPIVIISVNNVIVPAEYLDATEVITVNGNRVPGNACMSIRKDCKLEDFELIEI